MPLAPQRPLGVTFLALAHWAAGLFCGIVGPLMILDQVSRRPAERSDLLAFGLIGVLMMIAIFPVAIGIGLWQRRRVAYWAVLLVYLASCAGILLMSWPAEGTQIASVVVCSLIVAYLLRPSVRASFT
jgi:hypothetical protein